MSEVQCHLCSTSLPSSKAFSLHEKSFCSIEHLRAFKATIPPEREQRYQRFYNIRGYHHC